MSSWPPRVKSYSEFRKELRTAIKQHPPFGKWLKKRRCANYFIQKNKSTSYAMYASSESIEELKEMYIKHTEKVANTKHMDRFLCNIYCNDPSITEDNKQHIQMVYLKAKSQML